MTTLHLCSLLTWMGQPASELSERGTGESDRGNRKYRM
jgi:hypothetical protein